MPAASPRYRRRTGLVWRWSRNDVVVLGDDDVYRNLQGSAALVWSLLNEPMAETEIVDAATGSGTAGGIQPGELVRLVHEAVGVLLSSKIIVEDYDAAGSEEP